MAARPPPPPPRGALPPGFERFANDLFKNVVRSNKDVLVQPTFRDAVLGFYHAVDWTEPWVMFLLNLHVAVWVVAVATRSWPNVQIGLFLAICGAVYGAQFLNAYGARHWQALGLTQNYFDDRGVFISFMYSLPLLSAAGFQMVGGLAVTAVRRANLHELACACSRLALGGSVCTRGLFCRHRRRRRNPMCSCTLSSRRAACSSRSSAPSCAPPRSGAPSSQPSRAVTAAARTVQPQAAMPRAREARTLRRTDSAN